jgi:hypothetical protein
MNSNNAAPASHATQAVPVEEPKVPTVSLLPGNKQIVVRNLSKEDQAPWIVKNHGVFNSAPAVNGFVFPLSSIQAVRDNIPGLMGGSSIYDNASSVPVVFSTVVPKPLTKEKEKLQRQEMAKLGLTWNATRGQYEGDVSLHNDKVMTAILSLAK